MAAEKATALVLRTTDWSETSRIATLWTRELGKVRALAKGGRRLRSSFENALDLLTLCSIVLLRKSSGGLDLLTEAQVIQRFPGLTLHLPALYGAYYVAELLEAGTEENDPHPELFDHAVATLAGLNESGENESAVRPGLQVMRFEMQLLEEVGYAPVLAGCASCGAKVDESRPGFSVEAGGVVCVRCQTLHRDRQTLSKLALDGLRRLAEESEDWRTIDRIDAELRRVLGQYVTYRLGRRLRMLSYLEGLTGDPGKGSKRT
jgi:DNA repair protein RecO (recombination protein O)